MKRIFIIFWIIIQAVNSMGQGCSDAGFCSIDGIKHETNPDSTEQAEIFLNTIKTGISSGYTNYNVLIFSPYIEYGRDVSENFRLSVKMSSAFKKGPLTSTAGISDLIATGSYKFYKDFRLTAGIKIPLTDGNLSYQQRTLPMAYQVSLGTWDAIAGIQYRNKNWIFATAMQLPFIQNKNEFMMSNFTEEELGGLYEDTRNYRRAGDVLLRVSYFHKLKKENSKVSFIYSALPIYHLNNDQYTDMSNSTVRITGSKGLTLNLNAFFNYQINTSNKLEVSSGFPVISRKVRPDGLSQFSFNIEYIKLF